MAAAVFTVAAVFAQTAAPAVDLRCSDTRLNNISRSIYRDKHNAAQAHFGNNEAGQRRENQQDRIANGIRNGSMSAGEAARTENGEQNINRHIAADRSASGGRLTAQERRNINRRQNGASRQIHRQRHNGRNAPR